MNGFINLIKPTGATASDMVVKVKGILKADKVGHLGTLDPGATGVLPIAVGKATKLFDLLTFKKKKYIAYITFGVTTDTLDAYGVVIDSNCNIPTRQQVCDVLPIFVGDIMQVPPQYSALSINGVKAYKLARSGKEVVIPARPVTVYSLQYIRQVDARTHSFQIECSGGTYIRSLVKDIATKLNTVAYMSALIRTMSGTFLIDDAITIEQLKSCNQLLPIEYALADLETFNVSDKYYFQLVNGIKIECDLLENTYYKIVCKNELFGVGKAVDHHLSLQYYTREI